ncbi:MAG TPA: chemotaxis protein CheW [Planctomycetota bacterium]
MSAARQYCSFTLAGHLFGIDVLRVQEVLTSMPLTRVPMAPPDVAGLLNLRGHVVPALDLRTRLSLPPRAPGAPTMMVVIRTDEGPVSLLVDEIGQVIDPDPGSFERPPDTLKGAVRELIPGAFKLKDRLLLALDVDRLLAPAPAIQTHEEPAE